MPADTTVKIFHSDMVGAPVLNGVVGSLIGVLDACLVNGFGSGTVDSVVISGGIATVTRSTGHPFEPEAVAEIAGATVTGGSINGQQKVISTTTTTYTFDATGIPNQTATGTITHKLASAGWSKAFTGTNLAAYRSVDPSSSQFYLRVDDTTTTTARAVGYETMSDINTGTGPFPTPAQLSGGFWLPKSNNAIADARRWSVFADGRTVYFCANWQGVTEVRHAVALAFGDLLDRASSDPYAFGFTAAGSTTVGQISGAASFGRLEYVSSTADGVFPRPASGIGGPISSFRSYPSLSAPFQASAQASGESSTGHTTFPNSTDTGLYLAPMHWNTAVSGGVYRGRSAGYFAVPQTVGSSVFSHRQVITGVTNSPGKKFMAINSSSGVSFFDVTGPWV